jgi:hypothetical protein
MNSTKPTIWQRRNGTHSPDTHPARTAITRARTARVFGRAQTITRDAAVAPSVVDADCSVTRAWIANVFDWARMVTRETAAGFVVVESNSITRDEVADRAATSRVIEERGRRAHGSRARTHIRLKDTKIVKTHVVLVGYSMFGKDIEK